MLRTLNSSAVASIITTQVEVGDVDVEIHLPVEPSLKLPLAVCVRLKSRIDGAVYRNLHAMPHRSVLLTSSTLHQEGSTCVIPAKGSEVLKLTIDSEVIFLLTIDGAVAMIVIGDVECFVEVIRLYFSIGIGAVSWKTLGPTHFVGEHLRGLATGEHYPASLWVNRETEDPLIVGAPSPFFIERNQVIVTPSMTSPIKFAKFISFRSLLEKELQGTFVC